MAGAKESRRKQTKKRDEIETSGRNRGDYLGKDRRPIARNPKYGEAGANPVRGISTGLSPCPLQQTRTHGTPSIRANGVWLQGSAPAVFGCVENNYALLR